MTNELKEKSAMLYGSETLRETFLKYAHPEKWEENTNSGWYVTEYLANFSQYPVWTEFLERMGRIRETAPLTKDKRIKYKTAKSVAELFPKLDKEKLRILTRLLGAGGGDLLSLYGAVKENPPELIRRTEKVASVDEIPAILTACKKIKKGPEKIKNYLKKQKAGAGLYSDYIGECEVLRYPLSDEAVLFPKDLREKHSETSALCRYKASPESIEKSRKRAEKLKAEGAEYRHGRLMVRVPRDSNEIIAEGAKLSHCVGWYADRHAKSETTILFIRKRSDPDTPFFTLEMDMKNLSVKQCYGYKNRQSYRDNLEVGQLLEHYLRHLAYIKSKKQIKKGRKTA